MPTSIALADRPQVNVHINPGNQWNTVLANVPEDGWTIYDLARLGGDPLLGTRFCDLIHEGYVAETLDGGVLRYRLASNLGESDEDDGGDE